MSAEMLSLMRVEIHWEKCWGEQGLFGTMKRCVLWIVASVLKSVWWCS